jgi:hypothetical protein
MEKSNADRCPLHLNGKCNWKEAMGFERDLKPCQMGRTPNGQRIRDFHYCTTYQTTNYIAETNLSNASDPRLQSFFDGAI